MKNIFEQYTAAELREALTKRIELDNENSIKKEESLRQKSISFLIGKEFILERCNNNDILYFYSIDTTFTPEIKDDKWIKIKLNSYFRLNLHSDKNYDERFSNEIKTDSFLDFYIFDKFNSRHSRDEDKSFKSFNPNVVMNKIESISKEEYQEVIDIFKEKEMLLSKLYKHIIK